MKSLPGFAVNRVGSAPGAELFQFDTTGRVLLVLDREVVALLALAAPECNFYSCANSHFSAPPCSIGRVWRPVASLNVPRRLRAFERAKTARPADR